MGSIIDASNYRSYTVITVTNINIQIDVVLNYRACSLSTGNMAAGFSIFQSNV